MQNTRGGAGFGREQEKGQEDRAESVHNFLLIANIDRIKTLHMSVRAGVYVRVRACVFFTWGGTER